MESTIDISTDLHSLVHEASIDMSRDELLKIALTLLDLLTENEKT